MFERTLEGGHYLTRAELGAHLRRAGLAATGVRLALVTLYAELEGVICSGPRRGKEFTYALLSERAPRPRRLRADEALAELTRRYFASHGPATIRDFVWWSGLRTADAKRGLEMIRARCEVVNGHTYWTVGRTPAGELRPRIAELLPIYDEYLVAYRDRVAVPHGPSTIEAGASTVTFQNALVISGQVAGTWKIDRKRNERVVAVTPLRRLTGLERRALDEAVARYARFRGVPLALSIA